MKFCLYSTFVCAVVALNLHSESKGPFENAFNNIANTAAGKAIGSVINKIANSINDLFTDHTPKPDEFKEALRAKIAAFYSTPKVKAVETAANKAFEKGQYAYQRKNSTHFTTTPECDASDWATRVNLVLARRTKLYHTDGKFELPCKARTAYLLGAYDGQLGQSILTNISSLKLETFATEALNNATMVSTQLDQYVKNVIASIEVSPFQTVAYLIGTAVTMRDSFINGITAIKKQIDQAKSSLKTPLRDIGRQSDTYMASGARNFTEVLTAFDTAQITNIRKISADFDQYAGQTVSKLSSDLRKITAQVNSSISQANAVYKTGNQTLFSIYLNATAGVNQAVEESLNDFMDSAKQTLFRMEADLSKANATNTAQVVSAGQTAVKGLVSSKQDFLRGFNSLVALNRRSRDFAKIGLAQDFQQNATKTNRSLKNNVTLNIVAQRNFQQNMANSLEQLKFAADGFWGSSGNAVNDTRNLLVKTSADFENTTANYQQVWDGAKLAALGKTGDLSQAFVNQLASVGAESDAEVNSMQAAASAQKSQGQADLSKSRALLTASASDVSEFMSGAAVQVSSQTKAMQDLLTNKQSELNAQISGLGRVLRLNMQRSNGSLASAMLDLAASVNGLSNPTPDLVSETTTTLRLSSDAMNSQLSALMSASNVSASVVAQLAAAQKAGNQALFDSLMKEQTAGNLALANAVQAAADASKLGDSLSKFSSGNDRQRMQQRIRAMSAGASDAISMLRSGASSLVSTSRQALERLSGQVQTDYQGVGDASTFLLNKMVADGLPVPQALTSTLSQLRPLLNDFRTNQKNAWLSALQPLPEHITAYANEAESALSDYRTTAISDMELQSQHDLQAVQRFEVGQVLQSLKEFKTDFKKQLNSTNSTWVREYSAALGQFKASIETLQKASALASAQLGVGTNTSLDSAQLKIFDAEQNELKRVTELQSSFDDTQVTYLLGSANESVAAISDAGTSLKQLLLTDLQTQTKRTQQAAAQITQALNQGAADDADRLGLLATAESQALVNAQTYLDTLASDIGLALNNSNAGALAANFQASIRKLKSASVDQQSTAIVRADIQAMAVNASIATMSVADSIVSLTNLTGNLTSAIIKSTKGAFASAMTATGDAIGATGDGLAAINAATAEMLSSYTASLADADADRAEKAYTAGNLTAISGDALVAMVEAFQAQNAASSDIVNGDGTQVADQKATVAGLITLFGSLVDSTLNLTTTGYNNLEALELALGSYLTSASGNFSSSEQQKAADQLAIATNASKTVQNFDNANLQVVDTMKDQERTLLADELSLASTITADYKDFSMSKEQLQVEDVKQSAGIVQDLSQWMANMRKAVATDLKTVT